VARAVDAGVDPARILIAPRRDFGRAARRLADLVATGWPVLVSPSDEDFASEAPGTGVDERLAGPLAATALFAWLGARVFRVGHVRETRRALSMVAAIRGDIPPEYAVRGLA
jgi:dihydropteroate synthase